jgi:hypothetical protein
MALQRNPLSSSLQLIVRLQTINCEMKWTVRRSVNNLTKRNLLRHTPLRLTVRGPVQAGIGGIMSAIYSEERTPENALFDLRPAAGCVDQRAAHNLLRELRSFTALDRLDHARTDATTCSTTAVDFANECEEEFARALEAHRILWRYKPRTFAVEWDEEGNFVDSFTPGFYLPAHNRYVEVTAPDCRGSVAARKVRLLRQQYSRITIDQIIWPDYHNTVEKLS